MVTVTIIICLTSAFLPLSPTATTSPICKIIITSTLIAPLVEETLFRLPPTWVKNRILRVFTDIVLSIVFIALHPNWQSKLIATMLCPAQIVLRKKYGFEWCIALHSMINTGNLLIYLLSNGA